MTIVGGSIGKVEADDLTVEAYTSSATPALYAMAANGTRINSVVLSVHSQDPRGPSSAYLKITLHNSLVTSVKLSGIAGSERGIDSYSFGDYTQIDYEYIPFGKVGGDQPVPVKYDIKINRKS